MLSIKKIGEMTYLAALTRTREDLDRNDCILIKKELLPVLSSKREIQLDIEGVKSINNVGYKILKELMDKAISKNCSITFIHTDPLIEQQISELKVKSSDHR